MLLLLLLLRASYAPAAPPFNLLLNPALPLNHALHQEWRCCGTQPAISRHFTSTCALPSLFWLPVWLIRRGTRMLTRRCCKRRRSRACARVSETSLTPQGLLRCRRRHQQQQQQLLLLYVQSQSRPPVTKRQPCCLLLPSTHFPALLNRPGCELRVRIGTLLWLAGCTSCLRAASHKMAGKVGTRSCSRLCDL